MTMTTEQLNEKLKKAEEIRDQALKAAEHWEGRAAQLRELLAEINKPASTDEPTN